MNIEVERTEELARKAEVLERANKELETELEVLRNEHKLALADLNKAQDKAKRFEMENAELTAHLESVRREERFTAGLISGLKFAIRCNGISGKEVDT